MSRRPRRAAVLGSPVAHSLSPALHSCAYRVLGLDHWSYDRYEVDEHVLPGFLARLRDRAEGPTWAGLSLTMPLKRAVIPLLDEVTVRAAAVESVNTVLRTPDGRLTGDNTDIPGLVAALRERGVHRVESATVLGAGATAASALAALAELVSGPVTVCVRGPERAARMRAWGERLGVDVRTLAWERAGAALTAPLVLSTTPKGAADVLVRAVPARPGVLFDVVYDPWPTALAAAWSAAGGSVLSGLDLLVHQATRQVELMTGRGPAPLARMRAVGSAALATAAAMC
ncbi:shikimate dehydrogenase [Streptomyces virginiae]|uniref:shikimate dehydrogenase n=1 Tax=Streptomyces virginiae TaxID=1961 RepID=UPI002254FD1A|nr:shikimate dehydrogenase [Streptomyces virginiae]MCX5176803.1 shikimate dehydrogenase [Streptomyces virginiae]